MKKSIHAIVLCALAGAAGAVPAVHTFDNADLVGGFITAEIYNTATNGTGSTAQNAFDGNETTGVGVSVEGYSVVVGFTGYVTEAKPKVYLSEIEVVHTGASTFSLYTSEDKTAWTPVPDAQGVRQAGTSLFKPRVRALYVRFVFDTRAGADLLELRIRGWKTSEPKVVSSYSIASFHNANGTIETADYGGGDNWGANAGKRLFDGNFTTYWPWPRARSGSYITLDFTKNDGVSALQEYYVTKILIGSSGTQAFTLQYSDTGTNAWQDVPGAVNVKYEGTGTFEVGAIAKYVRYYFNEANAAYAMSSGFLGEIQVWGMDPADAPCTHPSYTEWAESVPATCTERAKLERTCTVCGEKFSVYSEALPLGHDYVTTLVRPGQFSMKKNFPDNRRYGSGFITCSRCDFRLDFPTALDLVTNTIDGMKICGEKTEGIVRFTDMSATSENHPEWGPGKKKIIDEVWNTSQEWPYWTTTSTNAQYADFEFGTTVDLTEVEFSVYNHGYHLEFCSVDDADGTETKFGEIDVAYDEDFLVTKKVKETMVDPDSGEEIEVEVEKEVTADYQRVRVPFFETPVKHLRVRIADHEPIDLWGCKGIRVIEIHPWGTVVGASDFQTSKTTLLIFK